MSKTGSIVIVEDDHDDQEMLKEVFHELEISNSVYFFTSALLAFEYLVTVTETPFLIISDINLPGVTGFELKDKINKHDGLRMKNIPFIFLSTTSDNNAIQQSYKLGAQGYFVKPRKYVEIKEMMQIIVGYWKLSSI
jgi:CheY-like chemotaxis protein